MDYLKYIEFEGSRLLIFRAGFTHQRMAMLCKGRVASAGMMCATPSGNGKFFGESVSLRCSADKSLSMQVREWFDADYERTVVVATDPKLLEALGAKDIRNADWVEGETCLFPSSGRIPNATSEQIFLP